MIWYLPGLGSRVPFVDTTSSHKSPPVQEAWAGRPALRASPSILQPTRPEPFNFRFAADRKFKEKFERLKEAKRSGEAPREKSRPDEICAREDGEKANSRYIPFTSQPATFRITRAVKEAKCEQAIQYRFACYSPLVLAANNINGLLSNLLGQ